jgi:hypothetical protein
MGPDSPLRCRDRPERAWYRRGYRISRLAAFGGGFQSGEALFKVGTELCFHASREQAIGFGQEVVFAGHRPIDFGGVGFGGKGECVLGDRREWFDEFDLDGDVGGGFAGDDGHLPLAHRVISNPGEDGPLPGGRARESGLAGRIELEPGRPFSPVVEVVHQFKHFLGRSADGGGPGDAESWWLKLDDNGENSEETNDDDQDFPEHAMTPGLRRCLTPFSMHAPSGPEL